MKLQKSEHNIIDKILILLKLQYHYCQLDYYTNITYNKYIYNFS